MVFGQIITKVDKDFTKKKQQQNFKDKKISFQIRAVSKLKNRIVLALMFLLMKIRKNIQSMCQKVLSKEMLIYY